jgi:hypothetical protein
MKNQMETENINKVKVSTIVGRLMKLKVRGRKTKVISTPPSGQYKSENT